MIIHNPFINITLLHLGQNKEHKVCAADLINTDI